MDLTPDIATRAYEIYQDRGQHDGQADQDWMEAETEVRKGAEAHARDGSRSRSGDWEKVKLSDWPTIVKLAKARGRAETLLMSFPGKLPAYIGPEFL